MDLKSNYLPLSSNILNTPMPLSNIVQKDDSFPHPSIMQDKDFINDNNNILEKNKTILNRKNDSIYCLFSDKNNKNSGIIQERITAENEIESFDAPPCIILRSI